MQTALIFAAMLMAAGVLMLPRIAASRLWRATVTPLASIIGSGFLVVGPILDASFGAWAPVAMAVLCLGAWVYGTAIRFNIHRRSGPGPRTRAEEGLEVLASWALAFAYVISVAYYLNLFGAFAVRLTPANSLTDARLVTTTVMGVILFAGWTRGFGALERMEALSVGIKLTIIAGLLAGLAFYFGELASRGALIVNPVRLSGWPAVALIFGLLVTVQGFETVRYLGAEYDAATRIRAMKLSQGLSAVIYLSYIGLLAYVFRPGDVALSETAIIDMMGLVAPVLSGLLVAAALAAQFSAAIADTGGAGGLAAELTRGRVGPRRAYVVLVAVGLGLTWFSDIFSIIAHASRAFALYYAVQAAIAALGARAEGRAPRAALFAALAVLGVAIAAFGAPVE